MLRGHDSGFYFYIGELISHLKEEAQHWEIIEYLKM